MGTAFLVLGPVTLLMLAKARILEAMRARNLRRQIERTAILERETSEVA